MSAPCVGEGVARAITGLVWAWRVGAGVGVLNRVPNSTRYENSSGNARKVAVVVIIEEQQPTVTHLWRPCGDVVLHAHSNFLLHLILASAWGPM